jgi:hypothetical protein
MCSYKLNAYVPQMKEILLELQKHLGTKVTCIPF